MHNHTKPAPELLKSLRSWHRATLDLQKALGQTTGASTECRHATKTLTELCEFQELLSEAMCEWPHMASDLQNLQRLRKQLQSALCCWHGHATPTSALCARVPKLQQMQEELLGVLQELREIQEVHGRFLATLKEWHCQTTNLKKLCGQLRAAVLAWFEAIAHLEKQNLREPRGIYGGARQETQQETQQETPQETQQETQQDNLVREITNAVYKRMPLTEHAHPITKACILKICQQHFTPKSRIFWAGAGDGRESAVAAVRCPGIRIDLAEINPEATREGMVIRNGIQESCIGHCGFSKGFRLDTYEQVSDLGVPVCDVMLVPELEAGTTMVYSTAPANPKLYIKLIILACKSETVTWIMNFGRHFREAFQTMGLPKKDYEKHVASTFSVTLQGSGERIIMWRLSLGDDDFKQRLLAIAQQCFEQYPAERRAPPCTRPRLRPGNKRLRTS